MEEKILIDKETLKALAVDTRMNILKLLTSKGYTLSEIAESLGLGNSTIKEHLDILVKAGLIKKEDTDRKWKYYNLTMKGKRLIQPREVKVLFAFVATLVAAMGSGFLFVKNFFGQSEMMAAKTFAAAPEAARSLEDAAMEELARAPVDMLAESAHPVAEAAQIMPADHSMYFLVAAIVLVVISGILLGYYLKKRTVIVTGGKK